jgi:hypothetical protein
MSMNKKIEANRQNALQSTGPKTNKGKAAVRLNAMKHGLLSRDILLPNEDPDVLTELSEGLRVELQPIGEMEEILVERIISAIWRLRRLGRVEAGIFAWEMSQAQIERAAQEVKAYERSDVRGMSFNADFFELLNKLIIDKESHKQAKAKLKALISEQETEIPTIGQAFIRDAAKADALSKLSRYETTIERGLYLYKALHELQRLQAARAGKDAPLPVAVDIDISGDER